MQAIDLIRVVESAGGRFLIDGDRLGITPARAGQAVIDEIRLRKWEILDLLAMFPAMPLGLRLMRWEPKDPPVQLTRWETVTDTDQFIRSTLRQLEARLRSKNFLAGNWTLSTLIDRLAAVGCDVVLEDERAALQ